MIRGEVGEGGAGRGWGEQLISSFWGWMGKGGG